MPHPCVKRSFFFHHNVPFTYPKGVVDPDLLRLSFSFPYDKNRLSMTIPASVPVVLASHVFFPLYSLRHLNELKIWKYATSRPVSLRGCWRAPRTCPHVWTDCMRETAVRNPESDWTARMSACALTSRRVPCRLSAIPDGWRSPASSASSITSPGMWRS